MSATKKRGARLSSNDMRFVKFIGKCIRDIPGFTDAETANSALECFSDWFHFIEKRGLSDLPTRKAAH